MTLVSLDASGFIWTLRGYDGWRGPARDRIRLVLRGRLLRHRHGHLSALRRGPRRHEGVCVHELASHRWRPSPAGAGRSRRRSPGRFAHRPLATKPVGPVSTNPLEAGMATRKLFSHRVGLIRSSREAALAAIQTYNNPLMTFKSETFIVLMIMAWTYLLHAYYEGQESNTVTSSRARNAECSNELASAIGIGNWPSV